MYSIRLPLTFPEVLSFPEAPYHGYHPLCVRFTKKIMIHNTYCPPMNVIWAFKSRIQALYWLGTARFQDWSQLVWVWSGLALLEHTCWAQWLLLLPFHLQLWGCPSGDSVTVAPQVTPRQITDFCVWVAALKKPKWTQTVRRKKALPAASRSSSQRSHQHPHGLSQYAHIFIRKTLNASLYCMEKHWKFECNTK